MKALKQYDLDDLKKAREFVAEVKIVAPTYVQIALDCIDKEIARREGNQLVQDEPFELTSNHEAYLYQRGYFDGKRERASEMTYFCPPVVGKIYDINDERHMCTSISHRVDTVTDKMYLSAEFKRANRTYVLPPENESELSIT